MTRVKQLSVIVVGRTPEKMHAAIAVLESHGYAATGVVSEQEAARAISEQDELFAVVAGGSIDEPAQERLRAAAASKGAVLVTAYIGNDDPTAHFTNHVVPKLADAHDRAPGRLTTDRLDHAEGIDTEVVTRWVVDKAHSLTTLDPRTPLADLEPLADLVGDATVVGLGGSTRGAHELTTLMHRVLRFLVEEMGFRALAVEEDWTKGIQIDDYLRTGRGDPRALLADAWLPFQTEEILDVIRWMRSYNERHTADPVRFVGVDIASVRSLAYDAVAHYVGHAAPDRVDELEAHYRTLRPAAGIDAHTEWYRGQPDKQPFIDHARQAHDLVDGLPAGEGHALAVHHARVIVNFYEYHSTNSLAYAEHHLAANTIWWHEHTGDKVLYWGGSGHTANAKTRVFSAPSTSDPEQNAGSYLRDRYGPRYVSIGLTFDHGTVPYPVPPPPPAFADAALGAAGLDTYLLDLHASQPPPVRAWLTSPAKVRLIGPRFDPDHNAAFHLTGGSLAEWFDIIIHRQATTSTRPLT